jgi:hypothetical protein
LWIFAVSNFKISQSLFQYNLAPGQINNEHLGINYRILFFIIHHSRFFFLVCTVITFFISGLLFFVKTLKYKLKWFNTFIQTVIVLGIFVLFCKYGLSLQNNAVGLFPVFICITAGTVSLILGLIIYEKYGQI